MRSRLVPFWIVLVIVALASCSDRGPVSPSLTPTAAPVTAAVSTVRTPVRLAGELTGVTYAEPVPSCPGPSRAQISAVTGNLSHLGLSSLTSRHCYVSFNESTGAWHFVGTATFVAANGDELHATYSGDLYGLVPPPAPGSVLNGTGTLTITGGTGRFEDASGEGTETIVVTIGAPPMPIQATFTGSIVY